MALSCEAPSASALTSDCASLAAGLRVSGAQLEYPGADPQVAASLTGAIKLRAAALGGAARTFPCGLQSQGRAPRSLRSPPLIPGPLGS